MMEDFMKQKLPKGMSLPELDVEESPAKLTHVEVNYSKLIREALSEIEEVDVLIETLQVIEDYGVVPQVIMGLRIKNKE